MWILIKKWLQVRLHECYCYGRYSHLVGGNIKYITGITASLTLQLHPFSPKKKSEAYVGNRMELKSSDGPLVSLLIPSHRQSDENAVTSFVKGEVSFMVT